MDIDNWDEYRTAYQVARLRTVSAAAEVLGVHHATVIRHIDSLEGKLGAKLFQRHARGYTPTEAGEDLLVVAGATEDQLTQLAGRIHGRVLTKYQIANPEVRAQLIVDTRPLRLEYGEAHVALRAGAPGDDLDNIVSELGTLPLALYAHKDYVFRLYKCSDTNTVQDAVMAGAGIGFLPCYLGNENPNIKQMMAPLPSWLSTFWCVTHVDLHRTAKVHSFVTFLKEEAKGWEAL